MRRAVVCFVLLASGCEGPPPAETLVEVPAQFVGVWDASLADCAAGGGPLAVTVTPAEVTFPDSRLAVADVAPDGANAARIDGHFTGPGSEWDGSVRLELGDGVLSVVSGTPVVPRVKCP
jgi:hypothetical protein